MAKCDKADKCQYKATCNHAKEHEANCECRKGMCSTGKMTCECK